MAVTSINVKTAENINSKTTKDWIKTKTSNKPTSIEDRPSPSLIDIGKTTAKEATSKYDSTKNAIDEKLGNGVSNKLTDQAIKDIDAKDLSLSPDMKNNLKDSLVKNVTGKLTSPGMPLNAKSKLKKLIDKVCNSNGLSQMNYNDMLNSLLQGLSLEELMRLLACLSNPEKLLSLTISMLTNSDQPDNNLSHGLVSSIKSKKITLSGAKDIINTKTGKTIIKSNKSILASLNSNTNINNKECKIDDKENLFNSLPNDNSSMSVYKDDLNLYDTVIHGVSNNKEKGDITSPPTSLDSKSKAKIALSIFTPSKRPKR